LKSSEDAKIRMNFMTIYEKDLNGKNSIWQYDTFSYNFANNFLNMSEIYTTTRYDIEQLLSFIEAGSI
jgi:hypothetical protein